MSPPAASVTYRMAGSPHVYWNSPGPVFIRYVQEHVDDPGIEHPAGPVLDLPARDRKCERPAMGTITDEHFKRLRHGHNARTQRNGLAFETPGIAGSVEPLAMGSHNLCRLVERRLFAHYFVSPQAVLAHDEPLFRSQNSGLSQDRLWNL